MVTRLNPSALRILELLLPLWWQSRQQFLIQLVHRRVRFSESRLGFLEFLFQCGLRSLILSVSDPTASDPKQTSTCHDESRSGRRFYFHGAPKQNISGCAPSSMKAREPELAQIHGVVVRPFVRGGVARQANKLQRAKR